MIVCSALSCEENEPKIIGIGWKLIEKHPVKVPSCCAHSSLLHVGVALHSHYEPYKVLAGELIVCTFI